MLSQQEKACVHDLLRALIAIDTINPPGHEKRAAEYLYQLFTSHGIACEIQEVDDDRANFVAEIGSGHPVLEFNGHLDVVPWSGAWHYPPLEATERDGRIYGRGACDMKGGVAAMCAAMLSIADAHVSLNGTLRLCLVADEEHANAGTLAFQAIHPPADFAVIGEPTNLHIAVAHRGVARFFIDIFGDERHAALPPLSETAVTKAAKAVLALGEMNRTLRAQKHEVLPPPSMVVTMMQGYEKDNVIPAAVRLLTDYRLFPDTTEEQARNEIDMALQSIGITDYALEKRFFMPGGALPRSDAFVKRACSITAQILDRTQHPRAFDASCEQCFLLSAGVKAIICGPGSLTQAHAVDEFVDVQELELAAVCYKALACDILNGEKQ